MQMSIVNIGLQIPPRIHSISICHNLKKSPNLCLGISVFAQWNSPKLQQHHDWIRVMKTRLQSRRSALGSGVRPWVIWVLRNFPHREIWERERHRPCDSSHHTRAEVKLACRWLTRPSYHGAGGHKVLPMRSAMRNTKPESPSGSKAVTRAFKAAWQVFGFGSFRFPATDAFPHSHLCFGSKAQHTSSGQC